MISIIVAAIAAFVFGSLWYGPVFGKQWMSMMGWSKEECEKMISEGKKEGMAGKMTVMGILTIITAWAVSYLVPALLVMSFGEFFKIVFIIWLGFTLPVQMGAWLWEKKPFKLVVFNAVQNVLSLLIISAIIYYW